MIKIRLILLFIINVLPVISVASDNLHSDYFSKLLGVELGKQNLNDVQKMYGDAKIADIGDAATSRSSICYAFTQNNIDQIVIFSSNNELAGKPSYVVTQIEIQTKGSPTKNLKCNAIIKNNHITLSLIGKSKSEFSDKFGFNLKDITNNFNYSFCKKVSMKKDEPTYSYWKGRTECFNSETTPYYDICTNIQANFENNILLKLVLNRSESVC
jgi:hypothetical protein